MPTAKTKRIKKDFPEDYQPPNGFDRIKTREILKANQELNLEKLIRHYYTFKPTSKGRIRAKWLYVDTCTPHSEMDPILAALCQTGLIYLREGTVTQYYLTSPGLEFIREGMHT